MTPVLPRKVQDKDGLKQSCRVSIMSWEWIQVYCTGSCRKYKVYTLFSSWLWVQGLDSTNATCKHKSSLTGIGQCATEHVCVHNNTARLVQLKLAMKQCQRVPVDDRGYEWYHGIAFTKDMTTFYPWCQIRLTIGIVSTIFFCILISLDLGLFHFYDFMPWW